MRQLGTIGCAIVKGIGNKIAWRWILLLLRSTGAAAGMIRHRYPQFSCHFLAQCVITDFSPHSMCQRITQIKTHPCSHPRLHAQTPTDSDKNHMPHTNTSFSFSQPNRMLQVAAASTSVVSLNTAGDSDKRTTILLRIKTNIEFINQKRRTIYFLKKIYVIHFFRHPK